ncbi:adenosine deaminase AGSA-like [Physella acuta]|uniref:adenosine deaminase AGSA-like n=1 Tax=Physella acuta TaxID=109671 RepID=UPI0027DE891D|nr:adenosine deaminase AGSA-like [Physella acuta]
MATSPWIITTVLVAVYVPLVRPGPIPTEVYMKMRNDLIYKDENTRIGAHLSLSLDEKLANEIFMKEKRAMIDESRDTPSLFLPTASFYRSKQYIQQTKLYKLIQKMPKGAALHIHDQSMVSLDWIVKNATYRDNVYMCVANQSLFFRVFNATSINSACEWKSVKSQRAASQDVAEFDASIRKNLSMISSDPFQAFEDNQEAWVRFIGFFRQVFGLLTYAPLYRDMILQTLEEFYQENVQYLEIRGDPSGLYELDGTVHNAEYGVNLIKAAVTEFKNKHPDFNGVKWIISGISGVKWIISGIRNKPVDVILEQIKTTMYLHQKYPEFVIGYDLAGNEGFFHPFVYYIEALLYPSRQNPPYKLPYFFHAGETNWQGTLTDRNLIDAILLNTTRIGHGYAIGKHPRLMEIVKERDIAIEVQPISNQVLRLVSDFRNHPMAALIANNMPIVISSDDVTTLDSGPLSFDFFITFMTMSSEDANLTLLKQLAINSITYSQMNYVEKLEAIGFWESNWAKFIKEVISA